MLKATLFFAATSYFAWYLQQHETLLVYPFDATYATPAAAGEPRLTEHKVTTEDGEQLVMWRAEAAEGKATILYFSGNGGGLKERADRFRHLIDRGYGIVAPAYRGSSGSTGKPSEELLLDDARAFARLDGASPVVIYGESLGTALAIRLAAEGIGERIVLEAPFTSIPDLLIAKYPDEDLDHLVTQRWESSRYIGSVAQPLLVIHGDQDRLVPVEMGERIFGAASSTEKRFLKLRDKGHDDLWTGQMQEVLFEFLEG